jgi:hypothetical protein
MLAGLLVFLCVTGGAVGLVPLNADLAIYL